MKIVQRICTERNTPSINKNEMTEYTEHLQNKNHRGGITLTIITIKY
jgi:hypothetical protein